MRAKAYLAERASLTIQQQIGCLRDDAGRQTNAQRFVTQIIHEGGEIAAGQLGIVEGVALARRLELVHHIEIRPRQIERYLNQRRPCDARGSIRRLISLHRRLLPHPVLRSLMVAFPATSLHG